MSYILDALKKSEQQRQRGATPTLHSVQAAPEAPPARRRWLYPTLALMLAAAAYAVGTRHAWRAEPAPNAPAVVAVAPAPTPPAHEPAAPAPQPPGPGAQAQADASPAAGTAASSGDDRRTSMPADPDASRAQPVAEHQPRRPAPEQRIAAAQPPSREPVAGPPDEKILTVAELPASLRAELPAMTITVHSFSPTAKERLLGINNRLLREGDTLTPDLVLEKITPDGMIFNFKGTRFQRGLR